MRVLQVVPSLNATQGGIRTSVVGIAHAISMAGIEAQVVCVGDPDPPLAGVRVVAFKPGTPKLTRASPAMKTWLSRHAQDFDAVVVHTVWLSPTRYAVDSARKAGIPAFLVPHGMLDPDALAHHAWRKRVRWLQGEGRRVRACTLIFSAHADAQRARGTPAAAGLPHFVIANPVAERWFNLKREERDGPPLVVCLNRWHPRKGVLEFVRGLRLLHDQGIAFRAALAGHEEDAAYSAVVRAECHPLVASGRLVIRGLLDGSEIERLVAAADILVHPAKGYENFGNVIAEAAAAGVAVVASPRALLTPEMAAVGAVLSVEPEPAPMAQALASLIADAPRRARLGQTARAYALDHLGAAKVAAAWKSMLTAGAPAPFSGRGARDRGGHTTAQEP